MLWTSEVKSTQRERLCLVGRTYSSGATALSVLAENKSPTSYQQLPRPITHPAKSFSGQVRVFQSISHTAEYVYPRRGPTYVVRAQE